MGTGCKISLKENTWAECFSGDSKSNPFQIRCFCNDLVCVCGVLYIRWSNLSTELMPDFITQAMMWACVCVCMLKTVQALCVRLFSKLRQRDERGLDCGSTPMTRPLEVTHCVCVSVICYLRRKQTCCIDWRAAQDTKHLPTHTLTFPLRQYSDVNIEQTFILCFWRFCSFFLSTISISISVATVQSKDASFTLQVVLLSNSAWSLNPLRSLWWNETHVDEVGDTTPELSLSRECLCVGFWFSSLSHLMFSASFISTFHRQTPLFHCYPCAAAVLVAKWQICFQGL